jgi:hypothetical protein
MKILDIETLQVNIGGQNRVLVEEIKEGPRHASRRRIPEECL